MRLALLKAMGKKAFVQSIRPYNARISQGVRIFGLDTEYVPRSGQPSELLTWQLASSTQVKVFYTPLSIENIYQASRKMLNHDDQPRTFVYVVYFSLAEIQFFDLKEWWISEFKGKYKMKSSYMGLTMETIDLLDWYPAKKLEVVAKMWGECKVDYPIGPKVEAIAAGTMTKAELLNDPEFLEYACHDAVLTQRIYTKMRNYFLENYEVDIVNTMTPAATSASMFRKTIPQIIGQTNTKLRKMSLMCCWGGRMEALYRGVKPMVYEYDATGHHPASAIALDQMPLEEDWKLAGRTSEWLKGVSGVGKVYFRFPPSERYPCLPVYHDSSLLFPLEGFSHCTVTEAKQALEQGAMVKMLEGFYFNSGSKWLTDYLREIQDIRNKSADEAERQMLKLLSNGIIGKFFQKKQGVDLAQVQKYAVEHDIPFDEAVKLEGMGWNTGEVSVGSCFYPEWYSIILGYARASICQVSRKNEALIISSDSFVTETELPESFTELGITFGLKAQGDLVSYRTRFYRVGDKLAHHAVHSLEASKVVLDHFMTEERFAYSFSRILHLKESWVSKLPFGCRIERPNMTTSLGYDYKRRLLPDGNTEPWRTVEERDAWLLEKEINAKEEDYNGKE